MVNVFKTISQARKFLNTAVKSTHPTQGTKAQKLVVEAWKKKTGHSATILKDMARKMSAKANKNVRPDLRSKKYT